MGLERTGKRPEAHTLASATVSAEVSAQGEEQPRPIRFRREGERVLLDETAWPDRVQIARELVAAGTNWHMARYITAHGEVIRIAVANGQARYRIVVQTDDIYSCNLILGTVDQ